MDNINDYERIHPSAKKLWIIHKVISSMMIMAVIVPIYRLLYHSVLLIAGGILLSLILILILPFYEYRQWKYRISPDRVEIIHGIFVVRRTVIPISRIQHINMTQGFIQKAFHLSSVDLYTSGGAHRIEQLETSKAEIITEHLNALVIREIKNEQ